MMFIFDSELKKFIQTLNKMGVSLESFIVLYDLYEALTADDKYNLREEAYERLFDD